MVVVLSIKRGGVSCLSMCLAGRCPDVFHYRCPEQPFHPTLQQLPSRTACPYKARLCRFPPRRLRRPSCPLFTMLALASVSQKP